MCGTCRKEGGVCTWDVGRLRSRNRMFMREYCVCGIACLFRAVDGLRNKNYLYAL